MRLCEAARQGLIGAQQLLGTTARATTGAGGQAVSTFTGSAPGADLVQAALRSTVELQRPWHNPGTLRGVTRCLQLVVGDT